MPEKTSRRFWGVQSRIPVRGGRGCDNRGRTWGKSLSSRSILDSIYQIVVHSGIFALELLITATVLALVPYMVLRDLVARIASWAGVGKHPDRSMTNDKESQT